MAKNVNIIHFSANPGGIETMLPWLICSLEDYTFEVFVLRPINNNQLNVYENSNVIIKYGSFSNIKLIFKLWLYAFKRKDEIFHVYNIGPLYTLILKLSGVKYLIYSIHGTKYWKTYREKLINKLLWQVAFRKNFFITANSQHSKYIFKHLINSRRDIKVIYNPIPLDRFNIKENNNSSFVRIIYSGRLVRGKNMFTWLRIAMHIINEKPDTKCDIYGDGDLKQKLIEYSHSLGISDNVTFHGFRSDIENAYKSADLLLFLSEYESFGNVVVESILCGTPVIASDIPSMKEIFKDYPDFLVCTNNKLEENVMNKVRNIAKLKELAVKAANDFKTRFSHKTHQDKIDQIYAKMK